MKSRLFCVIIVLILAGCITNPKAVLRQGDYYTEEQGKAELEKMKGLYSNKEEWEARKQMIRENILKGMNLSPLPERTPMNAVIRTKRIMNGYSVENVYFESIPGYYVCGNLYRPLESTKKYPAILSPDGHFNGDSLGEWGRFRPEQQKRCATLARMGSIVFSYDMFAYGGESINQLDTTATIGKPDINVVNEYHNIPVALTMQTWNSIRAIDFLETLPDVDKSKIAITGASGGGTQTFLLAAIDDRVSVSVPAVMVSCHFFGGCNCESGLPIHESTNHYTNNAEISAMIAPKPMLMISIGGDWTKNQPAVEYPFIKRTYSFYNAEKNVENVHFPDAEHDYAYAKRVPMYAFMAKHLGLNLQAVTDSNGSIDESKSQLENPEALLVFSNEHPFPPNALKGREAIEQALKKL